MLLDLDEVQTSIGSEAFIPENFKFLLENIDEDFSFDQLERAAQSYVILRCLFSDAIRRYDEVSIFFHAFSKSLLEETKGRLRYDIYQSYPHMCARCFSYFGDCLGGRIAYYCIYCSPEKSSSRFHTDSLMPSFTPYTRILFGRSETLERDFLQMHYNTIFTARLIHGLMRGFQ